MTLILEIRGQGGEDEPRCIALSACPVTLGRGYGNDIILHDPYVSAAHLTLDCDGDYWQAQDTGSENGSTLNGKKLAAPQRVGAGDILLLGQTEVRLFTPLSSVPAALPLKGEPAAFARLGTPFTPWLLLLAALGAGLLWTWLEVWSEQLRLTLASVAAATLGLILLWGAFWSAAGRLARRRGHFREHISLFSLYTLCSIALGYLEAYGSYLSNNSTASQILSNFLSALLLACLLYGSLSLATRMPQKRRLQAAGFLAFGIVAGIVLFSLVAARGFNPQPDYPPVLKPYLAGLAPTDTPATFMRQNAQLFQDDTFKIMPQPPAPKK